jgi:hypothetical protein
MEKDKKLIASKPTVIRGFSLTLSVGRYGGFYCKSYQYSKRLCLGWMAITYFPEDLDDLLHRLTDKVNHA